MTPSAEKRGGNRSQKGTVPVPLQSGPGTVPCFVKEPLSKNPYQRTLVENRCKFPL